MGRFDRFTVPLVLGVTVVTLACEVLRAAENLTPTSKWGWEIKPYQFQLGDRPEIERVLIACCGNKSKAAKMLGISRKTLRRKIRFLGCD